jgi:dihydrofolate reductase
MRKIKSNFFISLDGVVESPDKWHFPYFNDEMGAAVDAGFATADAILMGRVLYNEWGAYWPDHADQPFGDVINSIKKYVVSNSLQAAEWENSEIISGDVAQKLIDLKARDGGDIAMSGSPTTVRWLLRERLVDQPAHASDRCRWGQGSALSGRRAKNPPRARQRRDLQDRRAEPQLRTNQGLTARRAGGTGTSNDLFPGQDCADDARRS